MPIGIPKAAACSPIGIGVLPTAWYYTNVKNMDTERAGTLDGINKDIDAMSTFMKVADLTSYSYSFSLSCSLSLLLFLSLSLSRLFLLFLNLALTHSYYYCCCYYLLLLLLPSMFANS